MSDWNDPAERKRREAQTERIKAQTRRLRRQAAARAAKARQPRNQWHRGRQATP